MSKGMVLEALFPRRCPVCGDALRWMSRTICRECEGAFQGVKEPKCLRCGKPLDLEEREYCADCAKAKLGFEKNRSVWVYNGDTRRSLAEYKYKRRREYVDYYVEESLRHLGAYIRGCNPDVLVPVPLHSSKLRVRGFNQAESLACGIGDGLGIPVLSDLLLRDKKTAPQKELDDKERRRNLESAFRINSKRTQEIDGKKVVVLVDDIYTTGSTLDVCAKELKGVGIEKVYAVTLCIGKGY